MIEALLDADPGNRDLNHLYGATLLAMGEPALAIWPFSRAAEAPDARIEDSLMLAQAHLSGGNPEDAVGVAKRILEESPNVLEAFEVLIEANERVKRYAEALGAADRILALEPDHGPTRVRRVSLLLLLDLADEAEAELVKLRQESEASDGDEQWRQRLCAVDATFIFEKQDEGYEAETKEAWERCLARYPARALVVSEAVAFFESQGESERSVEILRRAVDKAPQAPAFKIALAQAYAARGMDTEAEQLLVEAAQIPGRVSAARVLLQFYDSRGRFDEAISLAEQVLEKTPRPSPTERLFYADLLIRGGRYDAAKSAIAQIDEPESEALLEGRLLIETGRPREALERLDEGIRLWPGNSVARQLAAEAAEQTGDLDRAVTEYTEAVRSSVTNIDALDALAVYLEAAKNPDLLVQLVARYIHAHPNDPRGLRHMIHLSQWSRSPMLAHGPLQQLGQMPGHYEEAVALGVALRAGNPKEAVEHALKHEIDYAKPASHAVLDELTQNLSKLGRHKEALARTKAGTLAHPMDPAFHETHARALAAAGRPDDEIRAALDRALEVDPDRATALVLRGTRIAAGGQVDEALSFFDRAITADPKDPDAAWQAIELLARSGREAETQPRLRTLLVAYPPHAPAALMLARQLAQDASVSEAAGALDAAAAFARRAARFGGGAEARALLGQIELERNEPALAVTHLRVAIEAGYDTPSTRYLLGRALAGSGDSTAARTEYEAALAAGEFPEAESTRAALARLNE
jgi:tetratricopeptide (TPR) repeat protein